MGDKAEGMVNGNGGEEEWGQGSDAKIQTIVGRWWGTSRKGNAGSGGSGEDNDWGYGQVPNECRRDTDKRGIGSDNGPDDDKSDMLDDSGGEWTGEGPARDLQSTRIRLVEERVLRQTIGGKMKPRCWRTMWYGWTGR